MLDVKSNCKQIFIVHLTQKNECVFALFVFEHSIIFYCSIDFSYSKTDWQQRRRLFFVNIQVYEHRPLPDVYVQMDRTNTAISASVKYEMFSHIKKLRVIFLCSSLIPVVRLRVCSLSKIIRGLFCPSLLSRFRHRNYLLNSDRRWVTESDWWWCSLLFSLSLYKSVCPLVQLYRRLWRAKIPNFVILMGPVNSILHKLSSNWRNNQKMICLGTLKQ